MQRCLTRPYFFFWLAYSLAIANIGAKLCKSEVSAACGAAFIFIFLTLRAKRDGPSCVYISLYLRVKRKSRGYI